jgi:UDP-N-acetylmuramoyl-tripeptide--D-alanyl-D-alanine ligase
MLNIKQILEATKGKLINGDNSYIVKDYVLDSRNAKKDDFFIPIVGKNIDAHDYIIDCVEKGICGYFIEKTAKNKEEIILKSKNINKNINIIEIINSQDALYEIGKYNRKLHMNISVIAITGSVGKTSTREMISSILSKKYNVLTTYKNYNGYIGLSLMLLKLDSEQVAILEHGIDFIGEMGKLADASRPNIAVVTMIGSAHIGILGSQDNIFKEKLDIAKYMDKNCTLILNGDDKYLNSYHNENINILKYKMEDINSVKINENGIEFKTKIYNTEKIVKINEVGQHNIYNAIAAIKVAEINDVKTDDILKGILDYTNPSSRFVKIVLNNNIQIIDDTYNASIDSMKAGIKAIGIIKAKRKIVVLGDMLELGDYSNSLHLEVGKLFKDVNIDVIFTLGEKSKIISKEAKKYIKDVYEFDKREELISELCSIIKEDDIIYFKASNAMKFKEVIEEVVKCLKNR